MPGSREKRMIVHARIVVTMDGAPIENGAVAIEGDRIADVVSFAEVKARNGGEVVDLGEQALLPGLINAHSHLDYTCLRGKIPRQKSFPDWILTINAEKAKLSPQNYLASIKEGFTEAREFGTTTIANLTAFPELISQIQASIRTWWFAELIDVRSPERANEIVDMAVKSLKSAENRGLAPHAPFTVSGNLYRRCDEVARQENILLTTHLAESREEMQMFSDLGGPLADFLSSIGRDNSDLDGATPLKHAAEFCQFDARWLLVHLNEVLKSDLELLLRSKTKPHIVHCPCSHEFFGHSPFKFGEFRPLGFNICLGTDSLASNKSLSLFAEMRAFQRNEQRILPREILEMVTVNPALALQQSDRLGRIRPGFQADLISLPCATSTSVFEEIVAFDRPVDWVMVAGVAG
jgi:cytosine/adenosine deaminase-related metal-dependent hydrolase